MTETRYLYAITAEVGPEGEVLLMDVDRLTPRHTSEQTAGDLAELLGELLGYAPDYFIDKWDLRNRAHAWIDELRIIRE